MILSTPFTNDQSFLSAPLSSQHGSTNAQLQLLFYCLLKAVWRAVETQFCKFFYFIFKYIYFFVFDRLISNFKNIKNYFNTFLNKKNF